MSEILSSKRFWATVTATAALTVLCALGKIPVGQLASAITVLTGVLVAAYGVENAAAAHGASFPDPPKTDPGPTTMNQTVISDGGKVTPAETPKAKAAQAAPETPAK